MQQNNICVLINSCDKYSDLWDPFFHFFEKNWPDCPYPVYLATNSKLYTRKNVTSIYSGKHGTWSEELKEILNKIPCDHLIYLQDDYLLTQKVNNEKLVGLFTKMITFHADYLRLFPSPGPDKEFENDEEIGLISKDSEYRTSLQCAIWKTAVFKTLLNTEENPWEFEMRSPKRSQDLLFLSVKPKSKGKIQDHVYPITYFYLTAVIRGKWRRKAAKLCEQEGIMLNQNIRKIETVREMLFSDIYEAAPLFFKKTIDYIRYRILKG